MPYGDGKRQIRKNAGVLAGTKKKRRPFASIARYFAARFTQFHQEYADMGEMKKRTGAAAGMLAAAALVVSASMPTQAGPKAPAVAGFAYQPRLGITIMHGSLGSTRNSADKNARIQCSVSRYQLSSGSTFSIVSCSVRNAAGESFSCTSSKEIDADALMALRGDGFVEIGVDADGRCLNIEVEAGSDHVRKGA